MAKKGTTRHASDIQENRLKKTMGGYKVPNSGGGTFQKGDVMLEDFFLDGKTSMTPVQSKSVKLEELKKAKEQAFYMRKPFYSVVLCFGDAKDYYILEDKDFKHIYDGYRKYQELLSSGLVKED